MKTPTVMLVTLLAALWSSGRLSFSHHRSPANRSSSSSISTYHLRRTTLQSGFTDCSSTCDKELLQPHVNPRPIPGGGGYIYILVGTSAPRVGISLYC